ncbi:MAG: CvpA family protein [Giesbergeria sp.]|jgi:membrane protein required for colicin V production|nr:CvpA family protein [Giesbergeria sp.]
MAALDWIFVAVLLASMLMGAWRGLIYEVLSLAGWVVAFLVAQWFAADAAAWLPLEGAQETVRYAAGFILVFVVALFACGFLAWLGKKLVEAVGLRPVDRTLGAAFGVLRGLVVLLVMVVMAGLTPLHQAEWWQESRGAALLSDVLQALKPALPQELGKHLPA